jgi:hypothetical protein
MSGNALDLSINQLRNHRRKITSAQLIKSFKADMQFTLDKNVEIRAKAHV